MPQISVTPLGAGQDVGRSCILLSIGGKNVMLDCGMHMGFNDERRFPDFSYITQEGPLNEHLDCVIISHFHLDHCGALPYMTEMGETNFFTSAMIRDCMRKVVAVNLHQAVQVDDELEIKAYYAGHVLGAAMFRIRVGSQSVVYTGDYNMTPDRHPWCSVVGQVPARPAHHRIDRCRERDFLTKVHDCIDKGGKVLIPVFALGRAQELCILLETYWDRMNLRVPIYFAVGLTEKATNYYKMFITWTNQKIRKTFVQRNMFDFKHIKPFDRAFIDNPGPMILSGARKVELDNRQVVEVKMSVQYMSFSAHADAKGIMQLIQQCEPANVLLVHGEAGKMDFLRKKIRQEFAIDCSMPANGETVVIETPDTVPIDVAVPLLKHALGSDSKRPKLIHGALVMHDRGVRLLDSRQAMQELGLTSHQIRFTTTVASPRAAVADALYTRLRDRLPGVQLLPDGSIAVASALVKVGGQEDDAASRAICVSWTLQDEDLGSHLLSLVQEMAAV
ncbi:hypothetical protein HPB52_019984 [Rhipicephalus sanguineus]|uniref:Integrator complex subunit 11 n=1 Tax=Rhipicephalus sanguineus TaxID=34632 RepID=A0A9D4PN58_RHISA|nr:hypothetical protein HPB52_019984 [Rhipicephalus sanguineus]